MLIFGIILLAAFLIGSIPFGLLIAKLTHVKSDEERIGAIQIIRLTKQWRAGLAVFLLDALKGVVGTLLATSLGIQLVQSFGNFQNLENQVVFSTSQVWMTALFTVLGHCFSPWLKFRGGKGISTTFGVLLVLSPISALVGLLSFVLVFLHRRIASLSSIAALVLASVAYMVLNSVETHFWVGAALLLLVLIRYEANIDALLENKEKPFY